MPKYCNNNSQARDENLVLSMAFGGTNGTPTKDPGFKSKGKTASKSKAAPKGVQKMSTGEATRNWLGAIQGCADEMHREPDGAIEYLLKLKQRLEKWVKSFDSAPYRGPPSRTTGDANDDDVSLSSMSTSSVSTGTGFTGMDSLQTQFNAHSIASSARAKSRSQPPASVFSNFNFDEGDDDEDDDDDEDGDENGEHNDDLTASSTGAHKPMPLRNIYIRVLVMISDCLAARAMKVKLKGEGWMKAASDFENSYIIIGQARNIADEYYAVLLTLEECGEGGLDNEDREFSEDFMKEMLIKDSNLIECGAEGAARSKGDFLAKARNTARRLQRILEPQWQGRDNARMTMGEDAWRNNPNPKKTHYYERREHEEEYKQLTSAIEKVENLNFEDISSHTRGVKASLLEG